MSRAIGVLLVILLLVVYAGALRAVISRPFRALGILVAGMAVHNFVLMVLIRLDTPHVLIRLIQAWKEGLLLLLFGLVAVQAYRFWRARQWPALRPVDWLMIAYTGVVVVYAMLPGSLLHSNIDISHRLLGLRILVLIPGLYLFGRVFMPRDRADLRWVAGLVLGSAALVGAFGLVELWLVPTVRWIDWGVNDLSAWLGFTYHGPAGLPENFFQATSEGLLLRRMVSTYVSPLGIAYTGLLVVPIGIATLYAKRPFASLPWWLPAVMLNLALLGILFSVTRLALAVLVAEAALLYVLLRRRTLVLITVLLAGAVLFMFIGYPRIGPVVDRNLQAVTNRGVLHLASGSDPSAHEHLTELIQDFAFVRQHPLGAGLGASLHRFGATSGGTGESAVFDVFGEIGIVGGIIYLLLYLAALVYGLRAFWPRRRDLLIAAFPLAVLVGGLALVPITFTSDVWADFSVTFLFWWAFGYGVSLAEGARDAEVLPHAPPGRFSEPDALVI